MKNVRLLITVICIMAFSLGAKAQDKFDYAAVTAQVFGQKTLLGISMRGKYEEKEIASKSGPLGINLTPAIEEISQMNEQGWEVYANNVVYENPSIFIYYLRKKKN